MKLDDNNPKLLHISWENIAHAADSMATHIMRHEKPDAVIAQQDDIIIAALVCNIIEVPLCIAHLNNRQNGIILNCIPKLGTPINSGSSTFIDNYKNVDELVSYYQKRKHPVNVLCGYSRKDVDNPPDYSWVKLTKSISVDFPWEQQ